LASPGPPHLTNLSPGSDTHGNVIILFKFYQFPTRLHSSFFPLSFFLLINLPLSLKCICSWAHFILLYLPCLYVLTCSRARFIPIHLTCMYVLMYSCAPCVPWIPIFSSPHRTTPWRPRTLKNTSQGGAPTLRLPTSSR
jgi:hypothetical protein